MNWELVYSIGSFGWILFLNHQLTKSQREVRALKATLSKRCGNYRPEPADFDRQHKLSGMRLMRKFTPEQIASLKPLSEDEIANHPLFKVIGPPPKDFEWDVSEERAATDPMIIPDSLTYELKERVIADFECGKITKEQLCSLLQIPRPEERR